MSNFNNIDKQMSMNAARTAALFNQLNEVQRKAWKKQDKNWKMLEILASFQLFMVTVLLYTINYAAGVAMTVFYVAFVAGSLLSSRKAKRRGVVNK